MSKSKVDRYRGNRSHGKGNTKNHRGGGSNGGKGRGGSFKQKFSRYFKLVGQRKKLKPRLKAKPRLKTINLNNLNMLIKENKEIDLKELGYQKILGSGNIIKAIVIKNAVVTQKAKEKIENAGGKIE
jgi:large subunit ribosomal protein L15